MMELLTQGEIDRSIQWLCANGSEPVRYLCHKDLLDTPPRTKRMGRFLPPIIMQGRC